MEFTMEEFFKFEGGPTRFVDRLCGVLGIHASQVKIVSVYEGSVIINYEILVDDDDEDELEKLSKLQDEAFENDLFDFGAAILDYSSTVSYAGSDESVSSQTYVPILVVSPQNGKQYYQNDPDVFDPNLEVVSEVSTIYINETTFKEMEPEVIQKVSTQTIVVDNGETVIKYSEEESPKSIIIPIAFSFLAFIFIAFVLRYFIIKNKIEQIDIERKITRSKEPASKEMTEKKIISELTGTN